MIVTLLFCGAYEAHQKGAVARINHWLSEKTLAITAHAGFKTQEILVTGRNRITQEDLLAQLKITHGAPIFGVDIAEAQKKIESMPWIKTASITRRLPDKIVVQIEERIPIALWQYNKKLALIDAEGAVLATGGLENFRDLPLVVGEDAPQHVTQLLTLLRAEPEVAEEMASAVRIGQRRWDLHLKNNTLVKLPEDNTGLALSRLARAQKESNIFDKNIATIDLRLPEKFVIDPKES